MLPVEGQERKETPPRLGPASAIRSAHSQFENNYFTEMCSGSEAGSYLRLIDFVYRSTLGLRVIEKKKKTPCLSPHAAFVGRSCGLPQSIP